MKKVMIVDDDVRILRLLQATFGQDRRYRLLVSQEGNEALNLARREKPDMVFLDILMPNVDGLKVCEALKADPATAHIRVVVLTGLSDDSVRLKAMGAGAEGYVTKPFSPLELLQKVEDALHTMSPAAAKERKTQEATCVA